MDVSNIFILRMFLICLEEKISLIPTIATIHFRASLPCHVFFIPFLKQLLNVNRKYYPNSLDTLGKHRKI